MFCACCFFCVFVCQCVLCVWELCVCVCVFNFASCLCVFVRWNLCAFVCVRVFCFFPFVWVLWGCCWCIFKWKCLFFFFSFILTLKRVGFDVCDDGAVWKTVSVWGLKRQTEKTDAHENRERYARRENADGNLFEQRLVKSTPTKCSASAQVTLR